MNYRETDCIARDGVTLRCGVWSPDRGASRGTVVLLPGRREYLEKYNETAGELCRRGLTVHGLDWRGQGLSQRMLQDRRKGHVETFDTYLSDLCLFLQRHVFCSATRPPIVLGHSMGAHLALRLAHDLPGLFERLVLVSPMIDIQTRPLPRWLAPLLAGVGLGMGLGTRAVPSWGSHNPDRAVFQDNPLTSDRGRFEREAALIAAHPELGLGGVTFAWLAASLRSMELLMAPGFAEAIDLPVLCIGAGGDRIVSVGAQQRFCMRLPQGLFVCLEQARHEILQERDALRQDLWRHFDRFCGTAEEAAAAAR